MGVRNCDNCNNVISPDVLADQDEKHQLFFTVCIGCINTCYQCGQDAGYPFHRYLTGGDCDFCDHRSCRSCGVNLECKYCKQIACEECIKDTNKKGVICHNLKIKLGRLENMYTSKQMVLCEKKTLSCSTVREGNYPSKNGFKIEKGIRKLMNRKILGTILCKLDFSFNTPTRSRKTFTYTSLR